MQTALAVGSTLVALAFSFSTYERWLARHRRHELAWSIALAMFAVASAALAAGAAAGWNEPVFRVFYLFGAILNVPFLALGTVELLAGPSRGRIAAAVVSLFSAFATGVVLVAPLRGPLPVDELARGSEVFGPLPRVLAASASGIGALVVIGGALWSIARPASRAGAPAQPGARRARSARSVLANGLIALGTLITGASGLLNSVADEMTAFAVTLVVGVVVIFAGFLIATGGQTRPTTPNLTSLTGGVSAAPGAAASPRRRAAGTPRS